VRCAGRRLPTLEVEAPNSFPQARAE
jgi:hypothetical protein